MVITLYPRQQYQFNSTATFQRKETYRNDKFLGPRWNWQKREMGKNGGEFENTVFESTVQKFCSPDTGCFAGVSKMFSVALGCQWKILPSQLPSVLYTSRNPQTYFQGSKASMLMFLCFKCASIPFGLKQLGCLHYRRSNFKSSCSAHGSC